MDFQPDFHAVALSVSAALPQGLCNLIQGLTLRNLVGDPVGANLHSKGPHIVSQFHKLLGLFYIPADDAPVGGVVFASRPQAQQANGRESEAARNGNPFFPAQVGFHPMPVGRAQLDRAEARLHAGLDQARQFPVLSQIPGDHTQRVVTATQSGIAPT